VLVGGGGCEFVGALSCVCHVTRMKSCVEDASSRVLFHVYVMSHVSSLVTRINTLAGGRCGEDASS